MGSSERQEDVSRWEGVREYNGVGKMNESGEALLSYVERKTSPC